jgi:hypothetical protein
MVIAAGILGRSKRSTFFLTNRVGQVDFPQQDGVDPQFENAKRPCRTALDGCRD